ncbi:MAG: thiamine biosynthesis protein ThiF [Bacteroidetes bacterium 43-16]|nr:MAG: thiamine biosynthesis protein ThiF [Bacteroidetes bacterium 43-16]
MDTDKLFERYSRQIFLEDIGVSGQRTIMKSKVLVIGAGGLGSPVIQYLAAAGVGTLAVADHDQVELHNLNRQVIHSEATVGKAKVTSATEFATKLNSHIQLIPIREKIEPGNIKAILEEYELIIDCSDNFSTRYLVNDTCFHLNKPLVYGSILGFEGQLAVFNYQGSKQLRDLFPEPPHPGTMPDCDRNGVLGPLAGIIGAMMAMQALKIITGLPVATNQLSIIDTLNWNFTKISY